jgi:hypothetical protein
MTLPRRPGRPRTHEQALDCCLGLPLTPSDVVRLDQLTARYRLRHGKRLSRQEVIRIILREMSEAPNES